jgi:hypothetical protein
VAANSIEDVVGLAARALELGDVDGASKLFERGLRDRDHPQRRRILEEYAFVLWRCYEHDRASELFSALMLEPTTELATLQRIARAFFGIGRFETSVEVLQRAFRHGGSDPELLVQLASCLERCGRIEESVDWACQALRLDAGNRKAVRLLAHIDKRSNDYSTAIARIIQHLNSFPDGETWMLKVELAASFDRCGVYDRAWQALVEAKAQVVDLSRQDLKVSYSIRRRQGELSKRITDADLARWHATAVDDRQSIAFMAGFPRSGTTLLESILTSNSGVLGTDESGILTSEFIAPIVWQASDTLEAMLEIRGFDEDQIRAGRGSYLKYTSSLLGRAIGGHLLIEKDPLLTCDLAMPLRLFPEARIVMPIRDPRDVVVSYFFTLIPFNWNSSPSTDIREAARFYHDVMRHWLLFRKRLPWPSLETRYEDLVEQPAKEVGRLSSFLGIDFSESMLVPSMRRSDKMISTPTYADVTRPIYQGSVGRWKNYRRHLESAMPILDAWAKEFHYE